ncbi:MAG: hypothetical protein AB9880_10810 [Christensenellales bacterium]
MRPGPYETLYQTGTYALRLLPERPSAVVEDLEGRRLFELCLLSSCHTLGGRDVNGRLSYLREEPIPGGRRLLFQVDSSLWTGKQIHLDLLEDRLCYGVTLRGEGQLTDVEMLGGYCTGANARNGNARFYSSFEADQLFSPEPDRDETYWLKPSQRALIDLTGVPIPGRDHWFFTPPPFCFVLRWGSLCCTLGVTAAAGRWGFTEFEYTGGSGQELILRYEGYTQVAGEYELPEVQMLFGQDEYALTAKFCAIGRQPETSEAQPAWWREPIFCGWGAQCALGRQRGLKAPDLATQAFYEEFTPAFLSKGIDPGILVIDDKWQGHYGLNEVDPVKWPDMKGFIRRMHDEGRKVLLWLKAWDPEGVAEALCIRDFAGRPQAIDPTHPGYLDLFRGACRRLLGEDGLDADGFKIDFTARIPSCPGCSLHQEGVWGLELMRAYLVMVHDAAKAVKGDALIMCHCPHPYLADKLDMIRLNDINLGRPVNQQMRHRARLTRAALPGKLIDTDNWPMPDKASWLDYVRIQPELGVPSLYYLWCMDNSEEEITGEDLAVVRQVWRKYRQDAGLEAREGGDHA